jgi:hypothetical protein
MDTLVSFHFVKEGRGGAALDLPTGRYIYLSWSYLSSPDVLVPRIRRRRVVFCCRQRGMSRNRTKLPIRV